MKLYEKLNRQLLDHEAGMRDAKQEVVMVEATVEKIGDAIHLVHNAVKFSKRVRVDVRALDPLHLDVLSAWLVKLKQGGADLFMWSEDNSLAEVDVNLGSRADSQGQERGR